MLPGPVFEEGRGSSISLGAELLLGSFDSPRGAATATRSFCEPTLSVAPHGAKLSGRRFRWHAEHVKGPVRTSSSPALLPNYSETKFREEDRNPCKPCSVFWLNGELAYLERHEPHIALLLGVLVRHLKKLCIHRVEKAPGQFVGWRCPRDHSCFPWLQKRHPALLCFCRLHILVQGMGERAPAKEGVLITVCIVYLETQGTLMAPLQQWLAGDGAYEPLSLRWLMRSVPRSRSKNLSERNPCNAKAHSWCLLPLGSSHICRIWSTPGL